MSLPSMLAAALLTAATVVAIAAMQPRSAPPDPYEVTPAVNDNSTLHLPTPPDLPTVEAEPW